VCDEAANLFGLLRSRHGLAVSSGTARSDFITGPRALSSSGSSSRALYLLFRVLADSHPPEHLSASSTFLGVSFPIATSVSRVHHSMSSHAHLCSALSVSHALDGLLLCLPCGLISAHCHVRDLLLRGFPRCQADPTRRRAVPSCRLPTFASSRVAPTVQLRPARLQGFHPGSDPLRRAECLVLHTARSPLEFLLPRVLLRSPWRRLRASSARALLRQTLRVTPATGLQRINR
jgi:hypothetical protein